MRSSLKSEIRTKWMNEDEIISNNELQSEITKVILIIEREQKQSEPQSNCNLPQVSKCAQPVDEALLLAKFLDWLETVSENSVDRGWIKDYFIANNSC